MDRAEDFAQGECGDGGISQVGGGHQAAAAAIRQCGNRRLSSTTIEFRHWNSQQPPGEQCLDAEAADVLVHRRADSRVGGGRVNHRQGVGQPGLGAGGDGVFRRWTPARASDLANRSATSRPRAPIAVPMTRRR